MSTENERAEKLAENIRSTVAEWPPITDEQRAKLSALLSTPEERK